MQSYLLICDIDTTKRAVEVKVEPWFLLNTDLLIVQIIDVGNIFFESMLSVQQSF